MAIPNSPAARALKFYHRPDDPRQSMPAPSRTIMVALGRLGDVMSILPYAYHLAQTGQKPIMLIAKAYASILDGVSYVERMIYNGEYDDIPGAVKWLRQFRPRDSVLLCQTFMNPVDSRRLTSSYETENWRVMGALDKFGQFPLVFDRRDKGREAAICASLPNDREMILVATKGNSAPFDKGAELLAAIKAEFEPARNVVDLESIKVERIYDLLGLFDRALCLVAVDSAPLHLARASAVPLIALIGDDPWVHSVEPPTTVRAIRYDDARKSFAGVIEGVKTVINADGLLRNVTHIWDRHGQTERHHRARESWSAAYGNEYVVDISANEWGDNSTTIGDARALPRLKDIFKCALSNVTDDNAVIVFTNSDVGLAPNCFETFRRQAAIFGAFSVRRVESGLPYVHPGREVFGFRAEWLRAHMDAIPDFWIGCPAWDMVLAALIRKERGIISTKENMALDMAPCELPAGIVTHEAHVSQWAGDSNRDKQPANLWNLRLAREWLAKECPSLRL